MAWNVEIDKEKCTGCEECIGSCPASVLELDKEGKSDSEENIDECLGCETCVEVCPEEAITVSES